MLVYFKSNNSWNEKGTVIFQNGAFKHILQDIQQNDQSMFLKFFFYLLALKWLIEPKFTPLT